MTELVDVPVLGTGVIWRVGSSPTKGKIKKKIMNYIQTSYILPSIKLFSQEVSLQVLLFLVRFTS